MVSQVPLNGFYVVPCTQGTDCVCVSKIMKTMLFQSSGVKDFLQGFPYPALRQMAPVVVCEYKAGKTAVIPYGTGAQPLYGLLVLVFLQHLHDEGRGHDRSWLVVFECAKSIWLSLYTGRQKLLFDKDNAIFEVDTIPRQAQQFP